MRLHPKGILVVLALLIALPLVVIVRFGPWSSHRDPAESANRAITEAAAQVAAIEAAEKQADETVWAKELLAEQCGHVVEHLWDSLNASTNKLLVLSNFPLQELVPPSWAEPKALPLEVQVFEPMGTRAPWTTDQWQQFLKQAGRDGWSLVQNEIRHIQFDTDGQGQPFQSRFYCSAHLANARLSQRAILEGDLTVQWVVGSGAGTPVSVNRIDASRLVLKKRWGEPGFRQCYYQTVMPQEGSFFIDPLILYDLDGDGLSEIILAAKNTVFHRQLNGQLDASPLCRYPPGLIFTGLIADFDGDGAADFLCAKFDGLYFFKGSPQGAFDEPGRLVWPAKPHLKYAQVLACGDIDGDGDLDVWLGQYKLPYDRGQMPTPYYDANDGYPSYLLVNDGHANWTDATISAGLGSKRWRRAYSGSLVDLNQDRHLELVVANDFAGLDIYTSDQPGHFADVTSTWIPEGHAFGMSQLCADFNGDGRLDLLLIGMNVPTVDRLRHLGCVRPGFERYMAMAPAMTGGNRLLLCQSSNQFRASPLSEAVARTGWSWGASAGDFNNDGFPDLYIVNGHETRQSVRDYETEFWLHDIYVGNSRDSLAALAYFQSKFARTRGGGMSYGGYEKNRFFLNQQGESFTEIGHLMGVALEQDSRNVVADDLDGDGRLDLLVTTFEAWPEKKQTLRIFSNQLEPTGNWIGFRLREQGHGTSPVNAQITLHYAGRTAVQQLVTGDSYRSQNAPTAHFGLGTASQVDSAEIRWSNGRSLILRQPSINQYHNARLGDLPDAN